MKILKDLNEKVKQITSNIKQESPRYCDVIIDSLCFIKTNKGSEAIKCFRLAERFLDRDEVKLDEGDFEIVKQIVNENPSGYYAWVHSQVMLKILEWERSNG